LANLIDFTLQHLLEPTNQDTITFVSAIAVLLLLALLLWWTLQSGLSNAAFAFAIGAILLAGFVPRGVYAVQHKLADDRRRIADARTQAEFLAGLAARQKEVEWRIAQHRSFSGEEAADFIDVVQRSDLSWMSLPDYSNVAFALLERSLTAKILDP